MNSDYWILAGVWFLSFLLMLTIPANKIRLAIAAFLFKQMLTYLLGLSAVELGLLEYPVRELADIGRTSFTYEYLAYPTVCAVFNVYYPAGKSRWLQWFYYFAFCTALTIPEMLLVRYTNLVRYLHWSWYWTWISLFVTFWATRMFCVWFFQGLVSKKTPAP